MAASKSRVFLTALVIAIISSLLGIWTAQSFIPASNPQADISALVFPEARTISEFSLVDQDLEPFTNENLKGKWSLVFVGYANCPDICPTTLSTLNQIYTQLQTDGDADKLQVLFLSVDPKRDTPEFLRTFIRYFNKDFIALTGNIEDINRFSHSLGAVYIPPTEADTEGDANYAVNHSSAIMLINPDGNWLARFSAPHDAQTIVTDYRKIRDL